MRRDEASYLSVCDDVADLWSILRENTSAVQNKKIKYCPGGYLARVEDRVLHLAMAKCQSPYAFGPATG